MKKITIFVVSTIISNFSLADFEIPNQFEDGQVTSASQMNENFQALKSEIEALKSQLEASAENNKVTFVGVTEEKFDGAGGLLAMGQACDAMVTGSFFCSSRDYHTSHKPNNITITSDAWLNYIPDNIDSTSWQVCIDWRNNSNSNSAHYIAHNGSLMRDGNCMNQKSVACCK